MKKILILALFFILNCFFANITYGTATIFYGDTLNGSGNSVDNNLLTSMDGDVFGEVVNFTYIKRMKLTVDFEFSRLRISDGTVAHINYNNIVGGYPVVNGKKGAIFISIGGLDYGHTDDLPSCPRFNTHGKMLGCDLVYVLNEYIYLEKVYQYSFFGGNYNTPASPVRDLSPEIVNQEFKIHFILTDNLGMIFKYHSLEIKVRDPLWNVDYEADNASLGIVCRL